MKALNSALKNLLVSSQVLSTAEADRLLKLAEENKLSLSEVILTEGIMSADDLRQFEAKVAGIPFLANWQDPVSFEVLSLLPEPLARNNNIVVVRKNEDGVEALGLSLKDFNLVKDFFTSSQIKIAPRLTSESTVKNLLRTYQKFLYNNFGKFLQDKIKLFENNENETVAKREALDLILNHANLSSARKVYFDVSPEETAVNYRIGRQVLPGMVLKRKVGQEILSAIPSPYSHLMYDLKDSYNHDLGGGAVFEKNDQLSRGSLENLGLPRSIDDSLDQHLAQGGLFLIGSDQVSAVKPLLANIAQTSVLKNYRVGTVEENLDKYLPHIKQIKVNRSLGVSTEQSLRQILTEDFDVVCIDNLDTPEALALASIAGSRGVLVVAGIEARSLLEGFELADAMLGDRYILASVLKGLMYVKPVPQLNYKSAKTVKMSDQEIKDLANFVDWQKITQALSDNVVNTKGAKIENLNFFEGPAEGVLTSDHLYRQKIFVSEFLPMSLVIKEMIKDGKEAGSLRERSHEEGQLSLGETAILLATKGLLDLKTAINIATGKVK